MHDEATLAMQFLTSLLHAVQLFEPHASETHSPEIPADRFAGVSRSTPRRIVSQVLYRVVQRGGRGADATIEEASSFDFIGKGSVAHEALQQRKK